jgi:hypothetical protein
VKLGFSYSEREIRIDDVSEQRIRATFGPETVPVA